MTRGKRQTKPVKTVMHTLTLGVARMDQTWKPYFFEVEAELGVGGDYLKDRVLWKEGHFTDPRIVHIWTIHWAIKEQSQ